MGLQIFIYNYRYLNRNKSISIFIDLGIEKTPSMVFSLANSKAQTENLESKTNYY